MPIVRKDLRAVKFGNPSSILNGFANPLIVTEKSGSIEFLPINAIPEAEVDRTTDSRSRNKTKWMQKNFSTKKFESRNSIAFDDIGLTPDGKFSKQKTETEIKNLRIIAEEENAGLGLRSISSSVSKHIFDVIYATEINIRTSAGEESIAQKLMNSIEQKSSELDSADLQFDLIISFADLTNLRADTFTQLAMSNSSFKATESVKEVRQVSNKILLDIFGLKNIYVATKDWTGNILLSITTESVSQKIQAQFGRLIIKPVLDVDTGAILTENRIIEITQFDDDDSEEVVIDATLRAVYVVFNPKLATWVLSTKKIV